jgi:putative membrane protein
MSKNKTNAQQVLAMMRTDLANERTLLAYGRTALMFTATGVTLIKFFPLSYGLHTVGWALGGTGLAIGILGMKRFTKMQQRLRQHHDQTPEA